MFLNCNEYLVDALNKFALQDNHQKDQYPHDSYIKYASTTTSIFA